MDDRPIKRYCREEVTGAGLVGRLSIGRRKMRLKLLSFDEIVDLDRGPIYLTLDDARVATITEWVGGGWGNAFSEGRSVYSSQITPNIVLIGGERWPNETFVRSVQFTILNAKEAFLRPVEDDALLPALSFETGDMSGQVFARTRPNSDPVARLDLKIPLPFREILVLANEVATFFSLSIGVATRAAAVRISPYESEVRTEKPQRGYFELRCVWSKISLADRHAWVGNAVFNATDAEERFAMQVALEAWISRRGSWTNAYALAGQSMRRRNVLSAHRLLNACAWFEAIPLPKGDAPISPTQLASVADAAIEGALRAGVDPSQEGRIRSILGTLSDESLRRRLKLACKMLRERFGEKLVPRHLDQNCARAVDLRGAAAHGDIDWRQTSVEELRRGILALELIAFLSMTHGLTLPPNVSRIAAHPLLDYLVM